ncbi:MAG TPA: hypothetical protein VMT64_02200, partial [Candidatus Binataceae bacterium]|nr:hypothetical protein [Candidatus Binataceae bacterium]
RFGPDAVQRFKALTAVERSRLKTSMQAALGDDDAQAANTNRFRLRRPSGRYEFEFRDGDLRVFYRVEGKEVIVDAIGRKRGNTLIIGGQKVTL